MRSGRFIVVVGFCVSAWATQVAAQDAAGGARATPDASAISTPDSFAVLELASDKKTIKGAFSFQIDAPKPEYENFVGLTLSGPFDDKESQAVLGDLDGLGNFATLGVSYERRHYDPGPNGEDSTANGFYWGLAYEAGRKKFEYADATTLATAETEETGDRFSFNFGYFIHTGHMLSVRARHEISFANKNPPRQICNPIATNPGSLECATLPRGAPEEKKADVLQFQYVNVKANKDGDPRIVNVRPGISRDFKNHITGIDVPVYLVRDSKSGLPSGGLKFSWNSKDEELQVVLFISQPLKL